MEDIASKLTEILNNPEIMKQIKNLTGVDEEKDAIQKPKEKKENIDDFGMDSLSPDMINTVMKLAPILSSMNNEDKYTSFLQSLRPLLSKSRQKKLDESSKFIKFIQIFPILKKTGLI